jgi:hypothetical protein
MAPSSFNGSSDDELLEPLRSGRYHSESDDEEWPSVPTAVLSETMQHMPRAREPEEDAISSYLLLAEEVHAIEYGFP